MRSLRLQRWQFLYVEAEWQSPPYLLGLIEQPTFRQVALCVLASRERQPLTVRMKSGPIAFRVECLCLSPLSPVEHVHLPALNARRRCGCQNADRHWSDTLARLEKSHFLIIAQTPNVIRNLKVYCDLAPLGEAVHIPP